MRLAPLSLALPLFLLACAPASGPEGSSSSSSSTTSSQAASSSTASEALNRYEDTGIGYSISVPSGWTTTPGKEIITNSYHTKGTAFTAPSETGTTLDEAFFHVAQMTSCPPLPKNTAATIAGVPFQRALWNDAAAGNLYEGVTYASPKDAGCLVLTGFLHSCNLGPDCGANHSVPFNKEALFSAFDAMAMSVRFLARSGS
jgi:hypothetical protein